MKDRTQYFLVLNNNGIEEEDTSNEKWIEREFPKITSAENKVNAVGKALNKLVGHQEEDSEQTLYKNKEEE